MTSNESTSDKSPRADQDPQPAGDGQSPPPVSFAILILVMLAIGFLARGCVTGELAQDWDGVSWAVGGILSALWHFVIYNSLGMAIIGLGLSGIDLFGLAPAAEAAIAGVRSRLQRQLERYRDDSDSFLDPFGSGAFGTWLRRGLAIAFGMAIFGVLVWGGWDAIPLWYKVPYWIAGIAIIVYILRLYWVILVMIAIWLSALLWLLLHALSRPRRGTLTVVGFIIAVFGVVSALINGS